jgi:hypothetical protein
MTHEPSIEALNQQATLSPERAVVSHDGLVQKLEVIYR